MVRIKYYSYWIPYDIAVEFGEATATKYCGTTAPATINLSAGSTKYFRFLTDDTTQSTGFTFTVTAGN